MIECLISLVILSAILLSVNLLINQTTKVEQYLRRKDQKEWLIFLAQFEEEVKKGTSTVIKENQIYYKIGNKTYLFEHYQNMIRKREISGGHQPMLTHVRKWKVKEDITAITFLIEFENGEKNEGIWTKPPT
ncbi:prepilin-type N-terminal cleavage/methylation domain-containing protein [Enterococcus ratti]|uniref:Prepilin-type N-terminal cleavage/methylation domain-containing protein n=1 Tax=Enterococcus ratti TaxID=150033 RepID=A0A1L8W9P2_9ENTE|nr:prepilin-type N-terminal cleavage/methylation domain-containing protein [Enterococcus ratti]